MSKAIPAIGLFLLLFLCCTLAVKAQSGKKKGGKADELGEATRIHALELFEDGVKFGMLNEWSKAKDKFN